LPDTVEVICVQLPGRETRFGEPLIHDLSTIVEGIAHSIVPLLDLPYVVFGHSVGGLISHHLIASLLDKKIKGPEHFVVSGRSAPSDETEYYKKIAHLPHAKFVEALEEYNGTPEELLKSEDLMAIYAPILRSDFLLSYTYAKPIRKIGSPITVFGGLEDRMSEMNLRLWQKETTSSCEVCMFHGGHFFIKEDVSEVLAKLSTLLKHS
jgi:surfactin synthase thioesterase subunit